MESVTTLKSSVTTGLRGPFIARWCGVAWRDWRKLGRPPQGSELLPGQRAWRGTDPGTQAAEVMTRIDEAGKTFRVLFIKNYGDDPVLLGLHAAGLRLHERRSGAENQNCHGKWQRHPAEIAATCDRSPAT